jgi:hypothetical protein
MSGLQNDEIVSGVIARLSKRILDLESINADLLAACETTLEWLDDAMVSPDELSQDAKAVRDVIHAAVKRARRAT